MTQASDKIVDNGQQRVTELSLRPLPVNAPPARSPDDPCRSGRCSLKNQGGEAVHDRRGFSERLLVGEGAS